MIVKSIPVKGKAFHEVLHYMFKSPDRFSNKDGQSFTITRNLRGKSLEAVIKEFYLNEEYRETSRSSSNHIYHEVISYSAESTPYLNLDILKELTEEYIALRAPNSLIIATPHTDQAHLHVHLAISGIQYRSGAATRLTRKEFSEVKAKIQQIQKERYPALHHSMVEHGKKAKEARAMTPTFKPGTIRDHLSQELKRLMTECKSSQEFYNRLQDIGLETYQRGGAVTGIIHDGKNYRFKSLGIELNTTWVNQPENTDLKKENLSQDLPQNAVPPATETKELDEDLQQELIAKEIEVDPSPPPPELEQEQHDLVAEMIEREEDFYQERLEELRALRESQGHGVDRGLPEWGREDFED